MGQSVKNAKGKRKQMLFLQRIPSVQAQHRHKEGSKRDSLQTVGEPKMLITMV